MVKNVKEKKVNVALQTWTVQNQLLLETKKVLKEISSIGFEYLELAGSAGRPPKEFNQLCTKCNLKIVGIHQPHLRSKNLKKLITEIRKNCGIFKPKYVTVMLNPYKRHKTKSYIEYAKLCQNVSEALLDKEVTLCYHCFSYDLVPLGDNSNSQSGLDILLKNTLPQHLSFELDTYFLFKSNIPYKQILNECKDRCKVVHVCDIDEEHNKRMSMGNGKIRWLEVVNDFIRFCQVKLFIIENRIGTPLESVKSSYDSFIGVISKIQGTELPFEENQ